MALSKSVKIICGVTISLMILSCLLFLWKRSGNPTRSSFEQSKLRNQDSVVLGYYNVVYQNVSTKAEKITPSKSIQDVRKPLNRDNPINKVTLKDETPQVKEPQRTDESPQQNITYKPTTSGTLLTTKEAKTESPTLPPTEPHALNSSDYDPFNDMKSSACETDWVKNCLSECVKGRGPIPRLVHFIHYRGELDFYQYLAVVAAKKFIKPDKIYILSEEPLSGCWWNRIKQYAENHVLPASYWVHKVRDQNVKTETHTSNFMRGAALYNMGGIYMDTDVVVVRSFDSLLSGDYLAVFGGEEAGNNPCNAVIAARQHSCFICEFHRRMCEKFETNYWGFSLDSLKYAASLKFKGVKLLKRTEGFHPFGWTKSEINEMFNKDLDKTPYSFDKVFSVHLFRRAAIWSGLGVWDRIKNYEWLSTSKSGAAIAFRQALPEGFGPEHLDVEKCIDIPILQ